MVAYDGNEVLYGRKIKPTVVILRHRYMQNRGLALCLSSVLFSVELTGCIRQVSLKFKMNTLQ